MVNNYGRLNKYKGKALFLAHDADGASPRKYRYAQAKGGSGQTLPLVIVDSGFRYTEARQAGEDFAGYGRMVDEALREPPLLEIEVYYHRVEGTNNVRVTGTITNVSQITTDDPVTFNYDNGATLWLMAFEERRPPVFHVNWFVRKSVSFGLDDPLPPGGTMTFTEVMQDLPDATRMANVEVVVLVDYRPDNEQSQYVSAQAALATDRVPPDRPANDDLANRLFFEQLPYNHTVDTTWATTETGEMLVGCTAGDDKSVWYEYQPLADERVTFDVSASGFDAVVSVWRADREGEPTHPLATEVGCSNDKAAPLVLDLAQDERYYIKVTGAARTGGNAVLQVSKVDVVPTATVTPTATLAPPSATTPPTAEPTTEVPTTPPPVATTPVPTDPPAITSIFLPQARRNSE